MRQTSIGLAVCGRMTTALPVRRPSAGAVPGRWGACLAVRTPPAAFVQPRDQSSFRIVPMPRFLVNSELLLLPNRSR